MNTVRGKVTLTDEGRFEVLGLISIALPGPWWWHTEDLPEEGAIFRCYEENNERQLAYVAVADISRDPEESDISVLEQRHIEAVDKMLQKAVTRNMAAQGQKMVRWMSSHLNEHTTSKVLVTAYVGFEDGLGRQYLDARRSVRGIRTIISGCFNVDRAKELAQPIFGALNEAKVLET
jgi:hypothetical protein